MSTRGASGPLSKQGTFRRERIIRLTVCFAPHTNVRVFRLASGRRHIIGKKRLTTTRSEAYVDGTNRDRDAGREAGREAGYAHSHRPVNGRSSRYLFGPRRGAVH